MASLVKCDRCGDVKDGFTYTHPGYCGGGISCSVDGWRHLGTVIDGAQQLLCRECSSRLASWLLGQQLAPKERP